MSYKSPIEVIWKEQRLNFENNIVRAVQDYGIKVNKEELEKALAFDRSQYEIGYEDGKAESVKHGRWELKTYPIEHTGLLDISVWECSVCGKPFWSNTPHCPLCGAIMDEEENQ